MQIQVIRGKRRSAGGRHANQRLRREGMVPAVLYGHQQEPETLALSLHDLQLTLERVTHVIRVDLDGKQDSYLLKAVQYDHLQSTPIHVDLMRVTATDCVKVSVAVQPKGEPVGLHEGGLLQNVLTDLRVECPLDRIPEALRPDISHLHVGQSLSVGDIEFPPDVKPLNDPSEVVLTVKAKRTAAPGEEVSEEVVAEGTAEPEVISRGKAEDNAAGE
ncbi:MAG: 50S ribosomal protein L25 [Phycisphaerae bacterium]|nr:50S ribosomal protein L25 [Phycisphaerae bacterium]